MKFAHVSIFAKDMEESLKFYQEVVGLKIIRSMKDNPLHPVVFLANEAGDTCVEIIWEEKRTYEGGGISLGFITDDADIKRAKLIEQGYKPTPMISPGPGTRFFFIKDPSGVEIQFVQEDH